jgi:phosphate/sulfate permease
VLAIIDLVVGVSNDAVNFLNSAIGSKAISFKTIMIVASIGIACGALFSSGMMEVARKGIFVPGNFMFDEIMIIFMAVMITDILLLDIFNTLGMPTSTTVSIVFNLLGAAVCIALIKISGDDTQTYTQLFEYINTEKAKQIIGGILLSVVVAFSVGALVQYISRVLLSYHFEKKAIWVGALFGGVALTALIYFILMKGIKGADIAKKSFDFTNGLTIKKYLETYVLELVLAFFVLWTTFSFVFIKVFKQNIYKLIIIIGTFSLALAFAGNDLVNFIGVPIAGWQSFEAWKGSGLPASEFAMDVLGKKVPTPTIWLFLASIVMVTTLWLSSKSKEVLKTSLDLSSQGETKERFKPNFLSRGIVRGGIYLSKAFTAVLPEALNSKIEKQFEKPVIELSKDKTYELPAFDMVRASVNLMVAGILISIATSYKLPLSTTYVTFMVAMGTSLADRAWGAESAVYRVSGVLNVIGGWFLTAISAFCAAAVVAFLISWNVKVMVPLLLLLTAVLLTKNMLAHRKNAQAEKEDDAINKAESSSIQGVIEESADNIRAVVSRSSKIYTNTIDSLAKQDLEGLKKSKKGVSKLDNEVVELKDNIFYFIKNLDESSVGASDFYINVLGNLQDMSQSLEYITKASHKHVNNNHLKLRFNQIKDLKETEQQLKTLFGKIKSTFSERNFDNINNILDEKQQLLDTVNERIKKQVARTRTEDDSPKNTTLYFSILLETKDLIKRTMSLLEAYKDQ